MPWYSLFAVCVYSPILRKNALRAPLAVVALVFLSSRAAGDDLSIPVVYPFVFKHECLVATSKCYGSRCWYRALADVPVLRKYTSLPETLFTIARGDSFAVLDGDVRMIKPGLLLIAEEREFWAVRDGAHVQLMPGDTVSYGFTVYDPDRAIAWAKGHFGVAMLPIAPEDSTALGRVIQEPALEWWAQVRTRTGHSGWAHLTPENVNIDSYAIQN